MSTEGPPPFEESKSRFSSRVEPFWLNPATIKGTVSIAFGLFILTLPQASAHLLRLGIGGALILAGLSDLWFTLRHRTDERRLRGPLEGAISVMAGIALLAWPNLTLRVVALIAAIYLVVRGVAVVFAAYRQRSSEAPWILDLVRGVGFVVFAAVVFLLPEGVLEGALVALAVLAVILGGVMLAYGIRFRSDDELIDVDVASVSDMVRGWLDVQDVGSDRREEIGDNLYFEEPARIRKLVAWWVMLLLSVAIATFAILQDSTAVVIGAMLIAPLMTPIVGAAGAVVNGWRGRIIGSFALIIAGVGAAIGLAFIIGNWVPAISPLDTNTQVTSRTSPNLIDMLIALAAGAAGAYAIVDRRVSDSIAGVAIAVALVPPLGVVGLTLQARMLDDAGGAFLLFLTNLVSIILAATVVFFLTGFARFQRWRENRQEMAGILGTIVIAALVIIIPLSFTGSGILTSASRQSLAQEEVREWLGDETGLRVAAVTVDGAEVEIVLSGAGKVPPIEDLENEMTEALGLPTTIVIQHIPSTFTTYSDSDGLTKIPEREG